MIDLKDLRERSEVYKKNNKKKARDEKLIDQVLKLDEEWRTVKVKADKLRHERNRISEAINQAKKKKQDASALIKQAREIPEKLKNLQAFLSPCHNRSFSSTSFLIYIPALHCLAKPLR